MKSGLWILFLVLMAGVVVGLLLRPRLKRLMEDQVPAEAKELAEIEETEDPEARLERLRVFISDYPESKTKHQAYRSLARTMLHALEDTSRYLEFADSALAEEDDPDSRAEIYYGLYNLRALSDSGAAVETAYRLLGEPIDASWIYNYVGYDLAEKGYGLDAALRLCERALQLADSRIDSAGIMDSRGWVRYKMGDYECAIEDLEAAIDLFQPPQEEILRHLAYAALKAGQEEKAFDTLKTILIMGEYHYARAGLDSLMDARAYSTDERSRFEEAVWEERMNQAQARDAFALGTVQGNAYDFDPQSGAIAVINFMSPTCNPCRAEFPHLEAIHDEFPDGEVEILLVDVDNLREATSELAEEYDLSMPLLLDDKRVADELYGIVFTPTTVILDRRGREVFRHVGFLEGHEAMLLKEINLLLERS